MINYTPEEKAAAKKAKKAYKKGIREFRKSIVKNSFISNQNAILTGIMNDEPILADDYPVFFFYLYVVDDEGGEVIRSLTKGTIATLKAELRRSGMKAENIRRCNLVERYIY